jgi:hypothetical protein
MVIIYIILIMMIKHVIMFNALQAGLLLSVPGSCTS